MIGTLRARLRRNLAWVKFQELNREGWAQAWRRSSMQRKILATRPVRTAASGPREVHMLTWRRDWMNALWALKSFYHYSGADYPLVFHDGGLEPWQGGELLRQFPDARLLPGAETDARVEEELVKRGLKRCLEYRRQNVATKKVFDFFLLARGDEVFSIDSDIVFFRKPEELVAESGARSPNLYNEDLQYAYSMELDELEREFGLKPPPRINSGLFRVRRDSIDFGKIESWLACPKLFADKWVTEQTLHALCSTLHGVQLLPRQYLVSTSPGLSPELICKHYPGFFRPLLYQEGMRHLERDLGFLSQLKA